MSLGKQIKIARITAGVKQMDLARQLSISPTKLSLIESDHSKCSDDLLQRISRELNVDIKRGDN